MMIPIFCWLMIGKQRIYLAGAKSAGLVPGVQVPIVLTNCVNSNSSHTIKMKSVKFHTLNNNMLKQ